MDPFSGSGTSVLASSILGYQSIGIEVNPFLYFLSKIKCVNYSNKFNLLLNNLKTGHQKTIFI